MTGALAGVSLLAVSLAVSAMFVLARPSVIVVAPWPVVPMIITPVTTTSELSVEQIEGAAAIPPISRLEIPYQRGRSSVPELE